MSFQKPWEQEKCSAVPEEPGGRAPLPQELLDAPTTYQQRLMRNTEHVLTPKSKLLREVFVRNLVKDWNPTLAAIRAGVSKKTASTRAAEFMREPYTQNRIYQYLESLDEEAIVSRKQILVGLLKEANDFGLGSSQAARIAAWAQLAKMMGMMMPAAADSAQGGVMEVPMPPSLDAWEQAASSSQRKLKDDVRN